MLKLAAISGYEDLVGRILKTKAYHFPGLENVKVVGIMKNPILDGGGNIGFVFADAFGGEMKLPFEELEFTVLPDII